MISRKKHKDIEFHVHTSGEKVSLIGSKVDAAIRLAASEEVGQASEFLMRDALCFVSTPMIAQEIEKDKNKLYEYTLAVDGTQLLDFQSQDITKTVTEQSFKSLKLDKEKLKLMVFGQSDNVVLSALTGQSTAVTRLSLCLDELESGRLQIVLNHCVPLNYGYSLVYPETRAQDVNLLRFKKWLGAEIDIFKQGLSNYMPAE